MFLKRTMKNVSTLRPCLNSFLEDLEDFISGVKHARWEVCSVESRWEACLAGSASARSAAK